MHEEWENRSLPSVEKLEKAWRNLEEHNWSEKRVFGRWTGVDRSREIEEMRNGSRKEVYIEPSVMLDRWGIERCRGSCRGRCQEKGRQQLRYRASIEQQGIRSKNRSSIDPPGIEKLSRRQEHSRSIHQVSRSCWDCDNKKTWEAWQIARYQGGVEEVSSQLFKTVFREEKNIDMNAIQQTTKPMIQST